MTKIKLFLCTLLCLFATSAMAEAEQVNGLWVSPSPAATFDASTVWYTIKNYKSGGTYTYLSTSSGYVDSPYVLKLTNTKKDTSDAGLWCLVSDGAGAYNFYNKALGTSYVLSTANSAKGAMVKADVATSKSFTFQQGKSAVEGWFIRDGKSGTNYWNQQGGYLAHWNAGAAVGDNNSTFVFEVVGDIPTVKEPEYVSTSLEDASYYGLCFKNGKTYISEGVNVGNYLITKGTFNTCWAFIGTKDSFKMVGKSGYWVAVKSGTATNGQTANLCYTVKKEASATEFTLMQNTDGTFEIARKGDTGKTFNPWGGSDAGKNIGFWSAGDANNRLLLINEAEMPITDYKQVNGGQRPTDISALSLWYDFPATTAESSHPWMEYGLPLGNGQIGATLLGGVWKDEIQLNEKTLYNGSATDWGDHGTYANLGSIFVDDLSGIATIDNTEKPINDYVRYLDIINGVAGVDFKSQAGTKYSRRYLTSAPHKVLVARYKAEGTEPLHLRLRYSPDNYINATSVTYTGDCATFGGKLRAVEYSTAFRVVPIGGTMQTTSEGIEVDGAQEIVLYMTAATNIDDTKTSFVSGTRAQVASRNSDILAAAIQDGWDKIYAQHTAQFSELMGRVDLQLADAASTKTTRALVDYYATPANRNKADGLFLEQLYFQYGRYLEVSSNNLLINVPSNLQGIWNDDSNTNFWHCDIHADVNVQMNYWPAEVTNLSQMHMPFLNNIITLSQDDRNYHRVAQAYKPGVRGWMLPTENNIFGGCSQWAAFQIKTLAAWNCSHLWQHYRYTLDKEFLRRALPAMLRAAQFIKDISTSKNADGTLYVSDEYSPEHGPVGGHSTAFAQQNSAELVGSILQAHEVLGSESTIKDSDYKEMKTFYDKLDKGLHTETFEGKTCLSEWADLPLNTDGDAASHRHLSHLMALFPYGQVSAFTADASEQQLYRAAVNSLHVRNATDVTGWSGGWKVNLHARALEGDKAREVFALMLKHSQSYVIAMSGQGGCYYNLWDAHSPFQIDGNFGYTSGVAEMLLQSYDGNLHLLPALPSAWKEGHVRGLKAIGDFTVDQEWTEGEFSKARILNNQGQPLTLTVGKLPAGMTIQARVNGDAVAVVYHADGSFSIPTNKPADVIDISLIRQDEVGISHPTANPSSGRIYTISGQPADTSYHGLVVKEGQVVVK